MLDKLARIDIGTHFFKVTNFDGRVQQLMMEFLKDYIKYGLERVPRSTRYVKVPTGVFASRTNDKKEYRFHINQYEKLMKVFSLNQIAEGAFDIHYIPLVQADSLDVKVKDSWVYRDYQLPIIDFLVKPPPPRQKLVGIQTGKGKDQPLTAKIKVPGGWKFMGEIKVGDKVISRDGTETIVTGVFPQGKKDIYKITFYDGRSTECGIGHLWKIFNVNTSIHKRWKLVDTQEIIRLLKLHNPRLYVDLIEPEDSKDIELPIEPYSLGAILGDGHIGKYCINLATSDDFIVTEVENTLPSTLQINRLGFCNNSIIKKQDCSGGNVFRELLHNLNLTEKLSYDKFIPKIYLNSSKRQRLSILQGLMDTDGTVNIDGNISFCSSSLQLSKDVQYLVRSLGGIAKISNRKPTYTYKDNKLEGRPAYQVNIRIKNPNELFRLPRKKDKTPICNQYSDDLKLRIKSVEKVDFVETQCISVEHSEHLYVTDDFIVTHNTLTSMKAISDIGLRLAIVVRPMFIYKWVADVEKCLDIDTSSQVMVIQGLTQLMALFEQQKQGLIDDIKIFIISNKTLQLWFKLYQEHGEGIRELGYGITPDEMYGHLKVGVRLIDEVHLDFHLNFKIDLYSNIERSISLSATLDNKDQFLKDMYALAYPYKDRLKDQEIDKYAIARCVTYSINDHPDKIKSSENGSKTYSHNAFEDYLIKRPDKLRNYLKLIEYVFEVGYMQDYKKGERCVIFAYKKDMCTLITNYLSEKYPHLDVRRYVDEDPDENMYDPDVRVTTIGSGSTGHDIAVLKTAIMTVNVESLQANIQTFGRLRKIDGLTTRFFYFTCLDIPKHMQYHFAKMELLKTRALNFNIYSAPIRV